MAPLRILHVAPYSGQAWAYGGIPRLASSLVSGLARAGHDVTFVTTDVRDQGARLDGDVDADRAGDEHDRARGGVRLRTFRNVSNRLAYDWQLFTPVGLTTFMKRHAARFDVAHIHACRNLPGAIAAHYLQRAGVPYLLAPNGTAPNIERRRAAKSLFDAIAGRRVMAGARRMLAVSDAERRQFADLGVSGDRVRVVPNPIDLDEFSTPPVRGRFRRAYGLGSRPVVLYLGTLTPRKRIGDLVRAAQQLRTDEASLVIAGNDMGEEARLRRLVQECGLDARTRFTGLLVGRSRLEALADADVVVYPGDHEIFGLVPLEALLCGTPVVVGNDSGCGEVVTAVGGGLLVRPGDVDGLARAITDVLAAPARWRSEAADAARRIRERFGADGVCASLADVYQEMVNRA